MTFDSECRSTVEDALLWVGVLLGDGGGVGRVEDRLWRERGDGAAMSRALVLGQEYGGAAEQCEHGGGAFGRGLAVVVFEDAGNVLEPGLFLVRGQCRDLGDTRRLRWGRRGGDTADSNDERRWR